MHAELTTGDCIPAVSKIDFFTGQMQCCQDLLYKTAFIYMKNEQEALDMVSETVYKCYKNINKLKNTEYFSTWAVRILINTCLSHLKKQKKYGEVDETGATDSSIDITSKLVLEDALKTLRPQYKTCILLRYFHDLSVEETAKVMKTSRNTVKSYTRRALEQLRGILKEEDFYE